MSSPDPVAPAPPTPSAAAQRGFRHWMLIGVVTAVLVLVFLLRR
jgi:uncharacterized protein